MNGNLARCHFGGIFATLMARKVQNMRGFRHFRFYSGIFAMPILGIITISGKYAMLYRAHTQYLCTSQRIFTLVENLPF